MAQGKVVDYNLLLAAGAATVKPVSKEKDTVFSKFLDKGAEYLTFQKNKTAELIGAMPEVNMEKVDPEMYDKTVQFISQQRDIIVEASRNMTWYGKKSDKYKEAVLNYNKATSNIINANSDLNLLLTKRQWLIENDGKYDATTNQNQKINAQEIVNGTMFSKMDYNENGNIVMNGFLDPTGIGGVTTDKLIKDYKGPQAQDLSLLQSYRETGAAILNLKDKDMTDKDIKNFNIGQSGHVSDFKYKLESASDEAILEMLAVGSVFGSRPDSPDSGSTLMELFLTNGYGSLNNNNTNSYGEDVFDDTDNEFGLGYDVGTDEYNAAVEFLMKGDLDSIPGLKNELRQFVNDHFQKEFLAYQVTKEPVISNNSGGTPHKDKKEFRQIMNQIINGQTTGTQVLNVGKVKHPSSGADTTGYYVYVPAGETRDYSSDIAGLAPITNSGSKGGWFKVYYEAGSYKAHTLRYGSFELRNFVMTGAYRDKSFDASLETDRVYKSITNE